MTLVRTKGAPVKNDDGKNASLLSKMALNKLNMQAPELAAYVVAFKDLTKELPEDTGIQCGMIILDMKGAYMYAPVLAKVGEVQPLESLFCATTKTFKPITRKSVMSIISSAKGLGAAMRIPRGVARDPDLYDAIVPPKTGKFVYASEGRLGGFFSTLPGHHKQAVLEVITNDLAFRQAVAPIMDLDIVGDFLKDDGPHYVAPTQPEAPIVITGGKDLSEEQVQEVMEKGYTIKNPPKSTRVAVESDPNQALTTVSVLTPNRAYSAMKKNGDWVSVVGVRHVESHCHPDTRLPVERVLGLTEDGYVLTDPRIVVCNGEIEYTKVIEQLSSKRATEVSNGDYGMIFTGYGWLGPVAIETVESANGWTTINLDYPVGGVMALSIHPNVKTMYDRKGDMVYLSTSAMFYPMKQDMELMETDINRAKYKNDISMTKILPVQANLMHRSGVYAVDGEEIGGKIEIIEHLLKNWEIDVPTLETLTKSAEEKGSILVKMAAVRQGGRSGKGTRVQPIYESGNKVEPDEPMSGNARQRAIGMATSAKSAKGVNDREVMEATIISEMLQNPDLSGSIQEYLPEIKQAVDRLGRSLFLMRLNTSKLSDSIDAEALSNLFTATRNAYRMLGDNVLQLESLVATEID